MWRNKLVAIDCECCPVLMFAPSRIHSVKLHFLKSQCSFHKRHPFDSLPGIFSGVCVCVCVCVCGCTETEGRFPGAVGRIRSGGRHLGTSRKLANLREPHLRIHRRKPWLSWSGQRWRCRLEKTKEARRCSGLWAPAQGLCLTVCV